MKSIGKIKLWLGFLLLSRQYIDLARAKREASVSILKIKAIKFKLMNSKPEKKEIRSLLASVHL